MQSCIEIKSLLDEFSGTFKTEFSREIKILPKIHDVFGVFWGNFGDFCGAVVGFSRIIPRKFREIQSMKIGTFSTNF